MGAKVGVIDENLFKKTNITERFTTSTAFEIKRIGKSYYIILGTNSIKRFSENELENLVKKGNIMKIKVTGLSRAQAGRIVNSIKKASQAHVAIRRVTSAENSRSQVANFEIFLLGDDS